MTKTELNITELLNTGFEIGEIKDTFNKLGIELEEETNDSLIINVNPNRPDWLSIEGVVRSLKLYHETITPEETKFEAKSSSYEVIVEPSVKKVRPFTVCAVAEIQFTDSLLKSIIQLQEKLHITFGRNRKRVAIGVYPLDKIQFPVTFFAEDPKKIKFVPLNESREMNGLEILEEHEKGKEYKHLLQGKSVFPFFKDAKNNILSMPPIINSEYCGRVTESTSKVFIECSGSDLNVLKQALNIIVYALHDRGAEIYSVDVKYPDFELTTPELKWKEMTLNKKDIKTLLGEEIDKNILRKMGFIVDSKIHVPPYRTDILHTNDLIEDVAIAYDYDNFVEEPVELDSVGERTRKTILSNKLNYLLTGLGFLEAKNYSLTNKKNERKDSVKLFNSINEDYVLMRRYILDNLLNVLTTNKSNGYSHKLFEIGKCYRWDKKIIEEYHLGVLVSNEFTVTYIKQVLDYLFNSFGLKCSLEESSDDRFIPGRFVKISYNNKNVGFLGEIHPKILKEKQLPFPVFYFELSLEPFNDYFRGPVV